MHINFSNHFSAFFKDIKSVFPLNLTIRQKTITLVALLTLCAIYTLIQCFNKLQKIDNIKLKNKNQLIEIKADKQNQEHLNPIPLQKHERPLQIPEQIVIKQSEIQEQKDSLVEPKNVEQQNLPLLESQDDVKLNDKEKKPVHELLQDIFKENDSKLIQEAILIYLEQGGSIREFTNQLPNDRKLVYLDALWSSIMLCRQLPGISSYGKILNMLESSDTQEEIIFGLQTYASLVKSGDLEGVLQYAIQQDNLDLFLLMIENLFDEILDRIDYDAILKPTGNSFLMTAIQYDRVNMAELLIKLREVDVNQANDDNGLLPLELALHNKQRHLAEVLIHSGATANQHSCYEENTALHLAIEGDVLEHYICKLINNGALIDAVNAKGETALFLAIKRNFIRVVKALLIKGANPNYRHPQTNQTLLELAKENLPIKKLLVEKGANPLDAFSTGEHALQYAKDKKQKKFLAFLENKGFI